MEAADLKQGQNKPKKDEDTGSAEDPLLAETHEFICSGYKKRDSPKSPSRDTSRRLLSQDAKLLKHTIHHKALSTALQMARSHHAIAEEVGTTGKEGTTAPGKAHLNKNRVTKIRVTIDHQ